MSKKKAPRKEDGLDLLMHAIGAGSSGEGIRSQEAAGQQSLVNSHTLPTEMSSEDREALEAAGIVFGDVVENDYLFQYVQLPEGWTKSGTGHSMHSDLLDEKGCKRAGIFYKAAAYDRRAHLHCLHRYGIGIDYDHLDDGVAIATVNDGSEIIFTTEPIEFEADDHYSVQKEARAQAKAWLDEHYPEWENATAYWD